MNTFSHVPPGFRFHPTDEELVDYYLRKKIASRNIDLDVIRDVDLYKIEPWDLQEQEEGWVVCRVFKKRIATMRKVCEHESPIWYDDQVSFMPDMDSPKQDSQSNTMNYQYSYSCKREVDLHYQIPPNHLLQLPLLESPKLLQTPATISCNSMPLYSLNMHQGSTFQSSSLTQDQEQLHQIYGSSNNSELAVDQVTDWRVLDKFVASQLSHEDASKENEYSNAADVYQTADDKQDMVLENASISASSCQIDLWK
ncbi:hypothetical protein RJ639_012883 [Escallonia herrerae]|uniref:NAC domain-containing protein n=1 Tax=Escallonia herrerae TaxID=1293975 RepID=A0AA89ANE0_9ASTE|nr:hypothetical protein RJ639_012883 [Escallonia herrerae]